jgi:hypothetical protein
MGKAKGSLVPMRGSVENWGPGRHQRNLERKDAYARKMQEQTAKGPPDFEKLLSTGEPLPEKRELPKKKATSARKKTAGKPASKRSKKKATRGRR